MMEKDLTHRFARVIVKYGVLVPMRSKIHAVPAASSVARPQGIGLFHARLCSHLNKLPTPGSP